MSPPGAGFDRESNQRTGQHRSPVAPDDVLTAAVTLNVLARCPDDSPSWGRVCATTGWTATATVGHIVDALLYYAGQVARRARGHLPVLRDGRAAPPGQQLDNVVTAAHVLACTLRDLGGERAWHPSGLADAEGWAGMAVTEVLVHGHDAARVLGVDLTLPEAVCARTLERVFPWVPLVGAPPGRLLLAVTGRTSVPDEPSDPDWWWQSAPLQEWDGTPQRRTAPPIWR